MKYFTAIIDCIRSSEVQLQQFQQQPLEMPSYQSNDLHEYDTIDYMPRMRSSVVENVGIEVFSFTQCKAYESHKMPGNSGTATGSAVNEVTYENTENTQNQVARGEISQSYEDITIHVEKNKEGTYAVMPGED